MLPNSACGRTSRATIFTSRQRLAPRSIVPSAPITSAGDRSSSCPVTRRSAYVAVPFTATRGAVSRCTRPEVTAAGASVPESVYRPASAASARSATGALPTRARAAPRHCAQLPSPETSSATAPLAPSIRAMTPPRAPAAATSMSNRSRSGSASITSRSRSDPSTSPSSRTAARPARISARPSSRAARSTPVTGRASTSRSTLSRPILMSKSGRIGPCRPVSRVRGTRSSRAAGT